VLNLANKYKNVIIISVVVAIISLLVFGVTYAWFLNSQESSDVSNAASGGKLEVVYNNGQDIGGVLKPYKDNSQALMTTATIKKSTGSVDALATITLNVESISSGLSISAFKWEVYKNSETSPIKTGTFNGVSSGAKIDMVEDYLLTTSDTTFTIKLWLNGNETTNSVSNQTFSAYIDASAVNAPASIS